MGFAFEGSMDPRDLVVLTPPAHSDAGVAIAAVRAGSRGTLDLEWVTDPTTASAALARLAKFANGPFGVLLPPDGGPLPLADVTAARPAWIALSSPNERPIADVRAAGIEVLVEVTDLPGALAAVAARADGIILKGHEAGGRVGADTAFVLVQKWARWAKTQERVPPFWVRGGVGPNTAAACLAAGARGVVLDSQLLLTRESLIAEDLRKRLAGSDGGETAVLGERLGEAYRLYARADSPAFKALADEEERLLALETPAGSPRTRRSGRGPSARRSAPRPGSPQRGGRSPGFFKRSPSGR
jgi:hypothetical protein